MPSADAAQIYSYDAGAPAGATTAPSAPVRAGAGSQARVQGTARQAAARHVASSRAESGPKRAPSGPPLVTGTATGTGASLDEVESAGADASSSAPASGGDPLVENGLGSPLCSAGASDLSAASARNCATSGFEAAGAPTGNYALDVHIDTGALGFTAATLEQDYLIEPVWMGLVWVVHALVVALEWCFTLNLLDSSTMSAVERALRDTQAAFTRPWLVLALALASLATAYDGLVRRRVAETLGQVAVMLAMMGGGLWVIADPTGTVGALGRWVDEASAGTLGAVLEGTPARAPRTLADSMGGLFAGVVGAPWCYLEFGDVRWCVEPALLDRHLRSAALAIAAGAQAAGGCSAKASEAICEVLEGEQPQARVQSATLLRAARTNGELFLALPANQAARNSINDSDSLLRVLCGSSDATGCRGSTAPEAEFRTQGGTIARLGGLLLIAAGALGMLLLLGFIALHLLGSELVSLLYLLLAPAAVIAPALGDGGRAVFRAWAARLLGAVASKLVFSFLLGVVLLLTRTLLELQALGWWTRWLLVSSLWWGAYRQRRGVLGFMHGGLHATARHGHAAGRAQVTGGPSVSGGAHQGHQSSIARRVQRQLESPLAAVRAAQWVRGRLAKPAPDVRSRRVPEPAGSGHARTAATKQATSMLEREHAEALEILADAPRAQTQMGVERAQLRRVHDAKAAAVAAGDGLRAARLGVRAERIRGEIARVEQRLEGAHQLALAGRRARRRAGRRYTQAEVEERDRFLDAQAALPASGRAGGRARPSSLRARTGERAPADGARRDYAALASLVGHGREQYEQLDPRRRRKARLAIDRELALRRAQRPSAEEPGPGAASARDDPSLGDRTGMSRHRPTPSHDSRMGDPGALPRSASSRPSARRPRDGLPSTDPVRHESSVMRDAHEVARRRKRQLGD